MADTGRGRAEGRKPEPGVDNALGQELRALYQEIVREPIPERFIQLLDDLEQAEKAPDATSREGTK